MAEPEDPRLGTEIAGYRIEERIGRGGMGVVYRAQHMNLQRRAAIKIIAPEFAETKGFRSRFIREARIAAALQHPNIVTVYDAGQAGQTLYIAMQFIRGSDLAAILNEEGRLRPYRAIDVCRHDASALDAAHGMALIHRDVKPGNVLIAKAMDKSPDRRFQSCSDLISAARIVLDAAGPLADSLTGRSVSVGGGDAPDVATAVGREVPTRGAERATVPESERRARMLLAGVEPSTRAIVQVTVGDRIE